MIVDAGFAWQLDLVNDPLTENPAHGAGFFTFPATASGGRYPARETDAYRVDEEVA